MLLKNLRHRARLHWNLLNLMWRFDVVAEPAVTVKYWRSIRIGRHCMLQTAAYLYGSRSGCELLLGDHVVVSNACMLLAEGGIAIGSFTHLGPQVVITTQYGDSSGEMCTENPVRKLAPVRIGAGCWIGSGAVIMPGTVLGDRCIVSPNAVVFGSWGDDASLTGNPARRLRGAG